MRSPRPLRGAGREGRHGAPPAAGAVVGRQAGAAAEGPPRRAGGPRPDSSAVDAQAAAGRTPAETRGSLAKHGREGARVPALPPRGGGAAKKAEERRIFFF